MSKIEFELSMRPSGNIWTGFAYFKGYPPRGAQGDIWSGEQVGVTKEHLEVALKFWCEEQRDRLKAKRDGKLERERIVVRESYFLDL